MPVREWTAIDREPAARRAVRPDRCLMWLWLRQVVHFDVYGDRDSLESDVLYYNSFLPQDVRVIDLTYAEDGESLLPSPPLRSPSRSEGVILQGSSWQLSGVGGSSVLSGRRRSDVMCPCTALLHLAPQRRHSRRALDAALPPCHPAGFDSHFSSCGKTYLYKLSAGLPDPLQVSLRGGSWGSWGRFGSWGTKAYRRDGYSSAQLRTRQSERTLNEELAAMVGAGGLQRARCHSRRRLA
jgi:hypothetical protein